MNTAPDRAAAIVPALPESLVLDATLVERARDDGADCRGGRAVRHDGWTPERIRTFLTVLAETGCVASAAKAAEISIRSAYNLRNRAAGRDFHRAWEGALSIARRRLADAIMSRAMHGCVDQWRREGEVVGERVKFDNRLSMAMLTRLDQRADSATSAEAETTRTVVEGWDEFLDIVSAGTGSDAFFARRRTEATAAVLDWDRAPPEEWDEMRRLEDRRKRAEAGYDVTVDESDLDPDLSASWTEEQCARARRAGLLRTARAWGCTDPTQDPDCELVQRDPQLGWLIQRDTPPPNGHLDSRGQVHATDGNHELPEL